MSSAPQPPQVPQPQGYTNPAQFEFNDEHNRTISTLAMAMRSFATLMYLLGLVFVVFCLLTGYAAYQSERVYNWGFPVVLGAVGLMAVLFGLWTSNASGSFRKIVETRNQDVWHLMSALGSLKNMYATMRVMIIAAVVLAVAGGVMVAIGARST